MSLKTQKDGRVFIPISFTGGGGGHLIALSAFYFLFTIKIQQNLSKI